MQLLLFEQDLTFEKFLCLNEKKVLFLWPTLVYHISTSVGKSSPSPRKLFVFLCVALLSSPHSLVSRVFPILPALRDLLSWLWRRREEKQHTKCQKEKENRRKAWKRVGDRCKKMREKSRNLDQWERGVTFSSSYFHNWILTFCSVCVRVHLSRR